MTLLVFTDQFDQIRSGDKTSTIRANQVRWVHEAMKGNKLDVWFNSPRNPELNPVKYGIIPPGKWWCCTVTGVLFTREMAESDGFKSVGELIDRLMELHRWSRVQVLHHAWAYIWWSSEVDIEVIE